MKSIKRPTIIFSHSPIAAALAAAFSSSLLITNSAFAQTADTKTLPEVSVVDKASKGDYQPAVTTVGGKTPAAIRDVPQSVTVINRAVMDAQGAASLQDALRNVPGLTIGGAEGGQIGNNINLRGFSARTDIYLDGFRDRGQYYRDTFNLEAVEVLKGPSSMLFGRGSTGGVINQSSKLPNRKDSAEISATVGTDDYYRTTADLNKKLSDTSAFRVNLMAQDVGSTRDVMKNKDFAIAPSLRAGIGTPTEVTLSALVQHNRDMPDYGILAVNGRPADVRKDNYYGLTDDRTTQDVQTLNARVEHKISPMLTLRNQTQFSHYSTDARETYPNNVGTVNGLGVFTALPTASAGNTTALPLSQLFLRYVSHDRKIDDQTIYNQTDLTAKLGSGSIKHTVLVGAEIGRDTYENQTLTRNNLPIGSLTDPTYVSTPSSSVTTSGNLAKTNANSGAVYANDTIELGSQWKLIGGLRWDRYKASINNSINSSNTVGNTTIASASQSVNFTSVRAGVIYQPTNSQSYYISYGTSFNPSFEALTLTNGQQDLDPEKNRSYELGAKWDLANGNLSVSSALFQVEKRNGRTQVSTGIYELSGDIRVNGFEVSTVGKLSSNWQIIAGYTYLDAEIVSASTLDGTQGKTPANTPRHSATLWSTYNLTKEWEAGGGATYMSNRYASNTNVVSAGDYTRWDATVAYHQPKYDLRLNILNLTDSRDFISLIPSDGGRSVPTAGRTALLTATYKF